MTALVSKNPLWRLEESEATVAAAEYLRRLGWRCEEPRGYGEEFTPAELAMLLDQRSGLILARLHHPQCPATHRRLGPRGRLLTVSMSPELEAWLSRPADPAKQNRR